MLIATAAALVVIAPFGLAHRPSGDLETAYGRVVVSFVAHIGAGDLSNPVTPSAERLQAARAAYTGACSQCHGAAGDGRGAFGQTGFPRATDLTGSEARELSDGQMFWIVKNGLSFTPMPAFGSRYSDQQIWELVNFIRSLQDDRPPHLVTFPPTGQQLRVANLQPGGDARLGAEIFGAQACSACHLPASGLSIDPSDRNVADAVRNGRPGMPCYTLEAISERELQDLLAYVATFPHGDLGQDQGPPPEAAASPCNPVQ